MSAPDPLRYLYGCRYCGEPVTEHGTRYHHRIGLHRWQGPTPDQIAARQAATHRATADRKK